MFSIEPLVRYNPTYTGHLADPELSTDEDRYLTATSPCFLPSCRVDAASAPYKKHCRDVNGSTPS